LSLRRLFVSLIVLTFLLVPLMVIGLNPATAASYRGGGGGKGGGGGSGGHGGPGNGVHDCGGDPDCGGQVTVQVVETVEVISQVTNVVPVVHVVNIAGPPPGPVALPYPIDPDPVYDLIEYSIVLFLLATVGVVIIIGRSCVTGQHIPRGSITPRAAVKTSTDIPITKHVDSTGASDKVAK